MKDIVKKPWIFGQAIRNTGKAFILAGAFLAAQAGVRADSVDDLRQALPLRLAEQTKLTPAVLENRRDTLQKKVDNLRTIGDLRRALALEEWKDSLGGQAINEDLRAIDADMRKQVGTRLIRALKSEIDQGDASVRLAVANCITEIGPTVRSIVDGDRKGFARGLTADVIRLTQDNKIGVRQEALRALGNIFPNPKEAAPIFQAVLEKDSFGPKYQAASGLGQLMRVVNHLQKLKGAAGTGIEADQGDVLDAVVSVLGANSAGLKDSDPRIRAQCLHNIQTAAEALADLTRNPIIPGVFPPEGRKLTPEEQKFIFDQHDDIALEIKCLMPIINALRAQGPALARSLDDSDDAVRLAALEALENIGNARFRLKKRVQSVPAVETDKIKDDHGNRDLLKANDTLTQFTGKNLDALVKLLRDGNFKIRRKAVEFLEIIEEAATPVLPLLAERLADEDRYVRRSAARAISNIAPEKAALAVPGLSRLLNDPDLGVRRAAARTLMEMGPLAQAAVPALASAVVSGDAVARIDAMDALRSIGPDMAKSAVPQLIEALNYQDHRVRNQAAKVLGSFGRYSFAATPALEHALGDEEQDVRESANQAILEINQGNKKW